MTQSNVARTPAESVNAGVPERVALLDPEVLDAVQHEVHARDYGANRRPAVPRRAAARRI